ncbi:MAG: ABC transporter substrate-binding protein [Alphaproteobacteria bacterium]|nr:ABC transporter substrate-binding protein [Alphaproteobacteria bacterium]
MIRSIIFFLLLVFFGASAFADEEKSAYDRVMETQTLRCGYMSWPPLFSKEPNTGEMSGIFYEYVEAVGRALDIKVEWVEELTPANYIEALEAGRVDMLCSGDWPNSQRGRRIDYVDPIFFVALYPYMREGEEAKIIDIKNLNSGDFTISIIDGEMSSIIARTDFPLAKTSDLPQMSDSTQMLMNVVTKKADFVVTDVATGMKFQKNNPNVLTQVSLKVPVRLFPNSLSLMLGEEKLRRMMNTATLELLYNGQIEKMISKYEEFPNSLYRITLPVVKGGVNAE